MPDAARIIENAEWLPLAYDRARDVIRFGRIPREALSREAFLDQRMAGSILETADLSLSETAGALDSAAPAPLPAFIFHTSFCCSTLLARALDAPGAVIALKEPNILLDIANALRVDEALRREPKRTARLVRAILRLLARPRAGELRVLVKPTNAANTLLDHARAAGAPSLLLYGGLRDYLVSILKKGEEGRSFVRQQFNIFALDAGGLSQIPHRQSIALTDLQIAAIVWRHQIEHFARALSAPNGAPVTSLEFRMLLERPADTLKAAARALELPIPEAALEAAAAGGIFAVNAKFEGQPYDAAARDAEETALAERWKTELDLILNWAGSLHLGADATLPLAHALGV